MGNKPSALPQDPQVRVYAWMAHGSDECDPVTKQIIRIPLPKDVIVLQSGQCGLPERGNFPTRLDTYIEPSNIDKLRRAVPDELEPILGSLARHEYDGYDTSYKNTLVKSTAYLFTDVEIPGPSDYHEVALFPSGVIEVPIKGKIEKSRGFRHKWSPMNDMKIFKIRWMFTHALYPTNENLNQAFKDIGVELYDGKDPSKIPGDETITYEQYNKLKKHSIFTVNFNDMIQKLPGVHYHTACRNVQTYCIKSAMMNRSKSNANFNRSNAADERALQVLADLYDHPAYNIEQIGVILSALPHEKFSEFIKYLIAKYLAGKPVTTKSVLIDNQDKTLFDKQFILRILNETVKNSDNPEQYSSDYDLVNNAVFNSNSKQKAGALWPPKYYRGLSNKNKTLRRSEITKRSKLSWKSSSAYRPFKTDKGAKTQKSSYTQKFHKKYPNAKSLPEIAKSTGIPLSTLRTVYNRGMAAWRTGHRPGASQQAWAFARVHSYAVHGKTWHTTDSDLH
jgi:hypothetical protein